MNYRVLVCKYLSISRKSACNASSSLVGSSVRIVDFHSHETYALVPQTLEI